MAPEQPRNRLKRTRPGNEVEDLNSPVSSTKKQRLFSDLASSPSTPKGFSAITSAIGLALNFGRRTHEHEAPNSLDSPKAAVKTRKPGSKSFVSRDIYAFPDSGDEDSATSRVEPRPAVKNLTPRKSKQVNGTTKDRTSSKIRKGLKEGTSAQESPSELPDEEHPATSTPTRGTGNRRSSAETTRVKPVPASQMEVDREEEEEDDEHSGSDRASPSRSAGRFARNRALESAQQAKSSPRSILTPQHKRRGRPPKGVTFDNGENTVRRIDLNGRVSKSSSQNQRPGKKMQGDESEEAEEEDEDDEVCVICSKPDSKAPNEIIFCENCDKAVHQKCYNVPVIPEDDWFCRECLQEDILSTNAATTDHSDVDSLSTTPDISNFEIHLCQIQRVLIDRCSGRRRMKLIGQSEAYDKTFQLVEQTVLAGEGNSMMIIGARGCGKTTVSHTSPLVTRKSD
jgi:origin recognition complex subunit 4